MLRWSLMLLILSIVEGTLSRGGTAKGSLMIAKVSFLLSILLFALFQWVNYTKHHSQRKV